MVSSESIWISGSSRSRKTARLIEQFCHWSELGFDLGNIAAGDNIIAQKISPRKRRLIAKQGVPAVLVFAANGDNRIELTDRISNAKPNLAVQTTTPLAFFENEVTLFWPLLIQQLNLPAQFPLRLRPEAEQEFATQLWRPELDRGIAVKMGVNEYRLVRRALDLLLLAGLSGTPIENLPQILEQGFPNESENDDLLITNPQSSVTIPLEMLLRWRDWCWQKGLLTYGIIAELYWRYLLPNETYQQHLLRRYRLVLADDVDDYPAIAGDVFEFLLTHGAAGAFTFNPEGKVRLGLGADPDRMAQLATLCRVERLTNLLGESLADTWGMTIVEAVSDPMLMFNLPEEIQSIQTTSRSQLLRQTAEVIIDAVKSGKVQPQEVAVIAPGLDAIARYTLIEILSNKGVEVESLNDQRALASSPIIRALLTLLALIYPSLGRLVDKNAIAEMLIVLSARQVHSGEPNSQSKIEHWIDPVRAGLLADYCYQPDIELPKLLPVKTFARWDRLGYRATQAYEEIMQWIEEQRSQQEQHLIPNPVYVLDRAIQRFLWHGSYLPYDNLSALRELIETAQQYWEVDARMRKMDSSNTLPNTTIGRFIQLLRSGTITANPYPVKLFGITKQAVTLANIFQYRSSRRFHKWQFWLDAGSPLWLSGGAANLFGAQLFLQKRFAQPWTTEDENKEGEERLQRILKDLLSRTGEKLYLCHSDLAVNGQEQNGPLLTLINAAVPVLSANLASL
ncbi:recombinase family protein [[Phormidium ambiguum] IAM M-71]|uniref:recombinase family protein n=1 Tax=[Phormidium ambiguum] IAM M-71 TaxID=454136 RepID=UPI000AE8A3CC|nr:recombinase family protein [Phormidium ambiguum]